MVCVSLKTASIGYLFVGVVLVTSGTFELQSRDRPQLMKPVCSRTAMVFVQYSVRLMRSA